MSGQDKDWRPLGSDSVLLRKVFLDLAKLLLRERILRGEDLTQLAIVAGRERQDARAVWRFHPMDRATRRISTSVNHRLQSETGSDLCHLLVGAADIDGPGESRMHAKDLLLPVQPFNPQADQSLPTREIDRGFQEKAVDEFYLAFLDPSPQLFNALGLKIHDRDEVVHLGKDEGVMRVVAHPVEMIQVAVRAVDPLFGEIGQPATARRMEVGYDVDWPLVC